VLTYLSVVDDFDVSSEVHALDIYVCLTPHFLNNMMNSDIWGQQ
jgi:hypothetical protein